MSLHRNNVRYIYIYMRYKHTSKIHNQWPCKVVFLILSTSCSVIILIHIPLFMDREATRADNSFFSFWALQPWQSLSRPLFFSLLLFSLSCNHKLTLFNCRNHTEWNFINLKVEFFPHRKESHKDWKIHFRVYPRIPNFKNWDRPAYNIYVNSKVG